eukprot:5329165-Alexandrium_andersonii.AAC.1
MSWGVRSVLRWARTTRPVSRFSQSGMNPIMRHLERTHLVSVKWLREQTQRGRVVVEKVESAAQAAGIFTKPFVYKAAWTAVRSNWLRSG